MPSIQREPRIVAESIADLLLWGRAQRQVPEPGRKPALELRHAPELPGSVDDLARVLDALTFISRKRLGKRRVLAQAMSEHDRVFDRHASALTEIRGGWVRGVAEQTDSPLSPRRDRLSILDVRAQDALRRRGLQERASRFTKTRKAFH